MRRTKAQEKVREAIELAVENVLEELAEYLAKHGLNVSVDVQEETEGKGDAVSEERLRLAQGLCLGLHELMGQQLGLVTTLLWCPSLPDPPAVALLRLDLEELETGIEWYRHDVQQVRDAIERWDLNRPPPAEAP